MIIVYSTEKQRPNKFAIINCILGIPTIAFLILLLVKGFLTDYQIIGYLGIIFLSIGIGYSVFILVRKKKK